MVEQRQEQVQVPEMPVVLEVQAVVARVVEVTQLVVQPVLQILAGVVAVETVTMLGSTEALASTLFPLQQAPSHPQRADRKRQSAATISGRSLQAGHGHQPFRPPHPPSIPRSSGAFNY